MLNGGVQPVSDANEVNRRALQPYQSLWLAHWKRTGSDAGGGDNISPGPSRSEELDYVARKDGLSRGVEAPSRSASGFGSIRSKTVVTGYNFTKSGRRSVGSNRMIGSLDGREADALFGLSSSNGGVDIETDKFDKGKEAAVSDGSGQIRAGTRRLEQEQQCCEIDLLCERNFRLSPLSDNSSDECERESGSCDHCLSVINKAWSSRKQMCLGIRLSPNSSEEDELIKSHIDFYSKLKSQKCDHGLGARRICSSADVPGRASAEFPKFSQSKADLLITNKTSVYAFKENGTFRSKRVISNIDGNLSSNFRSIFPFSGQNKHKVQLQSLSSSDDSRGKEYKRDSKASKFTIRNELSAETDTLETGSVKEKQYKKNPYSASNSNTLTQVLNMEPNEVVFPSKVQNTCPSSTKSLTMETEKLLEHVNRPKAKSNTRLDEFQNGNRWVKRLKLSASDYSIQGETTPNHALITPREPTSKPFNGIPRSNTTKSRSNLSYHHNERSVATEKSRGLSKTEEEEEDHFSKNSNEKAKALLVSHAWIQRWLHSGGRETTKKESSKLSVEKLEKEHFPSIAAMALMSKVLTCFQECELQKRGSYTVWNTKTV